MRNYDYKDKWSRPLTSEIVALLTQIHEFKGEQTLFIEAKADTLTCLMDIAKIQSTESSNKIEGIYTSDNRLKALVKDKTRLKTRNERKIAGYRDVLNTIHESFEHIPPKTSIILQLHIDLIKATSGICDEGILDSALNGYELSYSQKELSDIILALASGEIGAEKMLQWIIEHQK